MRKKAEDEGNIQHPTGCQSYQQCEHSSKHSRIDAVLWNKIPKSLYVLIAGTTKSPTFELGPPRKWTVKSFTRKMDFNRTSVL